MTKTLPLFTLLPPFYDNPPHKDVKWYLKKIEEEFAIEVRKYQYLKWAFDNDVFIINDEFVIRFPRTLKTRQHLKYEIEFLNFLQSKFDVDFPKYFFRSPDYSFAVYKLIPGQTLTSTLFKSLNKSNKELVVVQLIDFINKFHEIKPSQLKKFHPHIKDEYVDIEAKVEKKLTEKLFPKLSKKDVEIIQNFYNEAKTLLVTAPSNCSTHGDLYAYNVFWDKNRLKLGIIDFGDILIGDPARDFEVFYDYGKEYAEIAYEKYTGKKDPGFLNRAEIYYKAHGIYTLLSSLLGAQISFDYAYKFFFKKKFNL